MNIDLYNKLKGKTDKEKIEWLIALVEVLEEQITEHQENEDKLKAAYYKATYKVKNERGAGRKKRGESESTEQRLFDIMNCIEKGMTNKQIMQELNISEATFYRYKKLL